MKKRIYRIISFILMVICLTAFSGCSGSSGSSNQVNSGSIDVYGAPVSEPADDSSDSEYNSGETDDAPAIAVSDEEDAGADTAVIEDDSPPADNTETDEVTHDKKNSGPADSADDPTGENNEIMVSYAIVDTAQTVFYNNQSAMSFAPAQGDDFFGQDAHYTGNAPDYTDNGDGTVTDNHTGLMWQQDPGDKMTYDDAIAGAAIFNLAGYTDWRLPTIKELYSLIQFNGVDPSGLKEDDTSGLTPFIDTDFFHFAYGDSNDGDRIIDSQWATSTRYVGTTMNGDETMFGVNFADGRIKGYPIDNKTFFVIYVRGNPGYGINDFADNGDGTVSDHATGLMWMQYDSGYFAAGDDHDGALTWEQALDWAENLEYAGYSDWRLPNAKELQSIVDYTRSPATTHSAAIDPVFSSSVIVNEGGDADYPFYWTSTTHANRQNGASAVYISFGEASGWMQSRFGDYTLMDVHGAGAQRSDPKVGDPADYPYGHGPQGDVIRIYNYVRCARNMN